jgi:uncharacterized LabA/DUF88 family protein
MVFYRPERLALFIDGANLYHAARALNFDIDYRRLLEWGQNRGRMVRAYYYTAISEDQEYTPLRPLIDWLDYNGYTMVTRPQREFVDSMGRRRTKGNIDVELAVDMLELSPNIDHAVLFSGDGDFSRLVDAMQRRGVKVSVVSTIRTNPPMVSDELRRKADTFIDLHDLAADVHRKPETGDNARRHGPGGEEEDPGYIDD